MKPDTDPDAGAEGAKGAADSEPTPQAGPESPETSKEREIDELRRFRVRTVPPDMRRQWMLAETPVVSTLELQDTVPPNKRTEGAAPSEATTPRPFFNAPRVSSTAATRRLPRVVLRRERTMTFVVVAGGLAAAALLFGFFARSGVRNESSSHARPVELSKPHEPMALAANEEVAEVPRPPAPEAPATPVPPIRAAVNSETALETSPKPAAKIGTSPEAPRKVPQTSPSASGKIPTPKPRPESDIKSPLFGK